MQGFCAFGEQVNTACTSPAPTVPEDGDTVQVSAGFAGCERMLIWYASPLLNIGMVPSPNWFGTKALVKSMNPGWPDTPLVTSSSPPDPVTPDMSIDMLYTLVLQSTATACTAAPAMAPLPLVTVHVCDGPTGCARTVTA